MLVIKRQSLPNSEQTIELPHGSEILTPIHFFAGHPAFWYRCNPYKPLVWRKFSVYETGASVPVTETATADAVIYWGSARDSGLSCGWLNGGDCHIYEFRPEIVEPLCPYAGLASWSPNYE